MIDRRKFIQAGGAACAGALLGPWLAKAAASPAGKKPNVLFLVIEDCSPKRLGCYGNTVCQTPNLDRFAGEAVRFTKAHTLPPCSPSRTALLTGLRPTTTGVIGNFHEKEGIAAMAARPPLPELLKNAGYETIMIGKIGHPDKESAWTRKGRGGGKVKEPATFRGPGTKNPDAVKGSAFSYGKVDTTNDSETGDGAFADSAIAEISAAKDKPFFLAVGFHSTHLPFIASKKYFDMYSPEAMEIPKNPDALPDGMPDPAKLDQIKKVNQAEAYSGMGGNNPGTLAEWQEAMAAHYAVVSYVDAQIGRILAALAASPHADNTIVVVWSDHGFVMGEHFTWRKGQLLNESTQSILLVKAPGVSKPGGVHAGPVECMDLFPTFLDLCGLPIPGDVECASIRPALASPEKPWRKGALMDSGSAGKSLVTDRYRLTLSKGSKDEQNALYDHVRDPGESVNRFSDPASAAVVNQLKPMIEGGWRACLPGNP